MVEKKTKAVEKIIKMIDDCPGDAYLITMLCCYYAQFCSANKANKEFQYNIANKFDTIGVISNVGLTTFKVQTDVEFCKDIKENLQSYCNCGGDLDLLIKSFENLPELIK